MLCWGKKISCNCFSQNWQPYSAATCFPALPLSLCKGLSSGSCAGHAPLKPPLCMALLCPPPISKLWPSEKPPSLILTVPVLARVRSLSLSLSLSTGCVAQVWGWQLSVLCDIYSAAVITSSCLHTHKYSLASQDT